MNRESTIITRDPDETESVAESLGSKLKGGEVIELIGDVGAGKTAFVRGIAKGVGSVDRVSSPTFTVSQIYESDKITVHHYDFYRIEDLAIMEQELAEVMEDSKSVVVLEWAGGVHNILPDHVTMKIETIDEQSRKFTILIPEKFGYLEFAK